MNFSILKRSLAITLALAMLFPTIALADSSFTDTEGHWAADAIEAATIQGYISGYSDSTFRPDNAVTRAEFCKMINSAMTYAKTTDIAFSDVSSDDWYYSQVASAVSAGYMNGYENDTFLPDNEITRQEAASVIARLIPEPDSLGDLGQFNDFLDIATWAEDAIEIVSGAGYMNGDTYNNFRPTEALTRAEAVTLIQAVLYNETIKRGDFIISTGDQSFSDTIFTGPVYITLTDSQQAVFRNCQFLDAVVIQGADKVAFYDSNVPSVQISSTASMVELWAMGDTTITTCSVATGASLTESDLTASGFQSVTIADTAISDGDISLWGVFDTVTIDSPAAIAFREGSIATLLLNSGAASSRIHLQSSTLVTQFTTYSAVSVTGTGTISNATEHVSGSTFETEPQNYGDETAITTFTPWLSPSANSYNIDTDAIITISYGEAMYTAAGEALSAEYLQSSSISLRKDSATTGDFVGCNIYVGSDSTYITISPHSPWEEDTDYYVGIGEASLSTAEGLTNNKVSSMFSTSVIVGNITPTVSPSSGDIDVAIDTEITVDFGEALYSYEGVLLEYSGTVTDYILEAITLRSGSATGDTVSMDVSDISDTGEITLVPNSDLVPDTVYYLLISEGYFQNSAGGTNLAYNSYFTTEEEDGFYYSISLTDGDTKVDRNVPIVLTFSSALCDEEGNAILQSEIQDYIEDFVTLRQLSSSYYSIAAVLSADGKTLTITPTSPLTISKSFYIAIDEGCLFNSQGDSNEDIYITFTTSDYTLLPTVSPANGSVEVEVTDTIVVTFNEILYEDDGTYLTTSHLNSNVFSLHEEDAYGDTVDISVTASGQKVFTITPDEKLDFETTYCLVIEEGSLASDSKASNVNAEMTYTFSTTEAKDLDSPTVSISAMDSSDGSQTITLAFPDSIKQIGGSSITASYLADYISLHESSPAGDEVDFEIRISGSKTVYLDIEDTLYPGSEYYIVIEEGSIQNSDEQENDEMELLLETPAPTFTFVASSITKTSATLTVYYDYHCEMTFYLDGGNHDMFAVRDHYTPMSLTGSLKNSFSSLVAGTSYAYYITYTSLDGEVIGEEFTFTTLSDE